MQPHHCRAALGRARPATHPVELDLVFRTEQGTPVNPIHASRAFAHLAASAGLDAHPHLLRHALASAVEGRPAAVLIRARHLCVADDVGSTHPADATPCLPSLTTAFPL
jgi:integrase